MSQLIKKILQESSREDAIKLLERDYLQKVKDLNLLIVEFYKNAKPSVLKFIRRATKNKVNYTVYYVTTKAGILPFSKQDYYYYQFNNYSQMREDQAATVNCIGVEYAGKLYGIKELSTRPAIRKAALAAKKSLDKINKVLEKYNAQPRVKAKNDLVDSIKNALSGMFNPRYGGGGDDREIRVNGNSVTKDIRYLGNWVHDEENNYDNEDDSWREDDDHEIWAPGEYEKWSKKFKEYISSYSWANKVKLEVQTGEKNWAYFTVTIK